MIEELMAVGARRLVLHSSFLSQLVGSHSDLVDIVALTLKLFDDIEQRIRQVVEDHVVHVGLRVYCRVEQLKVLL